MHTGDSIERAIIIYATNTTFGILKEHRFLERFCTENEKSVKSLKQNLIKQNGKVYDQFIIIMNDGTERTIYFEITSFFDKFMK
jgi:hypothetical protein